MKYKMLSSFLNGDLQTIERELEVSIQAEDPLLQEACLHLLQAGGKRIRPVFVLLAAKFGDYDIDVIKKVAVSLELIHMASLVHDDVIDEALMRRGAPTIQSKWNNKVAMYTGDYIFAQALELITEVRRPEAHQLLSKTIVEVCLGEIEQIRDKYMFDQNLRTYFRRIKRKTALLIATSCQLGAIAAGAGEDIHKKLFRFGYYVGMSYQITDDILDFTATEKVLGKPAGGDLKQGNVTLPALIALRDPELRKQIETVHEGIDDDAMASVIKAIKKSGAIKQSVEMSERYLQKAFKELEGLPNIKARKNLNDIAKYIGKRKF
ncbi:heptaprenyl diphosphate synthase component II [Bacillus massiliigorillae]|uniref:heptaprenyl diphosphate synthase component II n=1 Tax=Bacillus massiliigorillae TaxID=1243664 RepID=UPI0003A7D54E|nr:heptaprenyl diphosphate synthase component II [Bacillus massiliigorillae]